MRHDISFFPVCLSGCSHAVYCHIQSACIWFMAEPLGSYLAAKWHTPSAPKAGFSCTPHPQLDWIDWASTVKYNFLPLLFYNPVGVSAGLPNASCIFPGFSPSTLFFNVCLTSGLNPPTPTQSFFSVLKHVCNSFTCINSLSRRQAAAVAAILNLASRSCGFGAFCTWGVAPRAGSQKTLQRLGTTTT